ncbi:MAG: hypothetical protein ACC707_02450 [Thiohalomonadales bacterium]
MIRVIAIVALHCGVLVTVPAYATETSPPNKNSSTELESVAADIKFVEKLLTSSSIVEAIKTNDSTNGAEQQRQALLYLEQAKKAYKESNKALAKESIKKAKAAMFAAARQSGAKGANEKLTQDYEERLKDILALLDAVKRIGLEKKQSSKADALDRQVRDQLVKAESQFKKSSLDEAKKTVDAAFVSVKKFIISLRDGDTLVRELNFANKEEEYKYELNRNDSHKMLVTVLLREQMSDPIIAKKVDKETDQAHKLRLQAEAKAGKGDFESAVKTLENSTQYIIRAIRAAGVYVPG